MKTASNFNILKGAILSILLLTIFGAATSANAQQSRITLQKGFCASIGASNTCNGTPASFPSSVTFTVTIGIYNPESGIFTVSDTSADVVVPIAGNANGAIQAVAEFVPNVWLKVCEVTPLGWVSIPRPDSSGGGSLQFGVDNCLYAQIGPGNNSLKFINGPGGATAADASITGRVVDANGAGISSARLTLVNAATGETKFAVTSLFGYYSFAEVEVGQLYMLSISHKRYRFAETQRVVSLADSMTDVDFVAMQTKR